MINYFELIHSTGEEIEMFTKRQRITAWIVIAELYVFTVLVIEVLGEIYFPQSWFHQIASIMFAGGAFLAMFAIVLSFATLAITDWQETKNTKEFVSLGKHDRIVSVHKIQDAAINLLVAGTTQHTILLPAQGNIPHVCNS